MDDKRVVSSDYEDKEFVSFNSIKLVDGAWRAEFKVTQRVRKNGGEWEARTLESFCVDMNRDKAMLTASSDMVEALNSCNYDLFSIERVADNGKTVCN